MFAAFERSIERPENLVKKFGNRIAFFNPQYVAGIEHLIFAQIHTDRAFKQGVNIARSYTIEFLVRLSAREQIEKALEIGIEEESHIGLFSKENNLDSIQSLVSQRNDSLFDLTHEKEESIRKFFEGSASGKDLQKQVFEKIALISV
jgi:tRNA threonylcarbamoyladenosine modification (KEOPS) complex Cgi121 subunit